MNIRETLEQEEKLRLKPWAAFAAETRGRMRPEEENQVRTAFQRDVGIVAQTMFLAAEELGLNGCMIGSFEAGKLKTLLDLPENLAPQLLLALGEGTDNIVVTDVGPDGNVNYFRDGQDVHYVPKRTLEDLIING